MKTPKSGRQREGIEMPEIKAARKIMDAILLLGFGMAITACQLEVATAGSQQVGSPDSTAATQSGVGLVVENDRELPETYPNGLYEVRLRAHGGISAMHWSIQKGALPPGIKLEDDGLLHGQAQRTGEFQFTVLLTNGRHQQTKEFVLRVASAFTLKWKVPARVNGNRIEGSAEVTNTTPDDLDLTFVVLAVAENGRATAIGYQHFELRRSTVAKELPFGETLPHGGYVIHVDAVGEVAPKKLIYRQRMHTPGALQVTVGP